MVFWKKNSNELANAASNADSSNGNGADRRLADPVTRAQDLFAGYAVMGGTDPFTSEVQPMVPYVLFGMSINRLPLS